MSTESVTRFVASPDDPVARARAQGLLSALDHRFAERVAALRSDPVLDSAAEVGIRWSLALACRQEAEGHVCAHLPRLVRDGLDIETADGARTASALQAHGDLAEWLAELRASAFVEVIGDEGGDAAPASERTARPLVLDEAGRLYLRRAFRHQSSLAAHLVARARRADLDFDRESAEEAIVRRVPGDESDDPWPRQALRVALARPLAIVTGGPGTGKTTMVARLIGLLHEQADREGQPPPRVRLLAPTGKAAAAMAQSFGRLRESEEMAAEIRDRLPTQAETIQRALHRQTRLDALGRPLPVRLEADVVVVDEASMVDLAWMDRLLVACEAVPRLVLLGDPDQLASVRAGAVLAELCATAGLGPEAVDEEPGPSLVEASTALESEPSDARLARSVVRLRRSHRFAGGGAIGQLAQAIRAGDVRRALALLADPELPEVSRVDFTSREALAEALVAAGEELSASMAAAADPRAKLARAVGYRVLCAHRQGPIGAEWLGARLDEALARSQRIPLRSGWCAGQLVLVTRNAPDQNLWNGDVGLVDESESGLRAFFPDGRGGVRSLSSGRLPTHESAFAMTVHKSQGSEFDRVDLVLGDHDSRLMTRELLYTGVTRARSSLRIHASEVLLRAMIERRIERDSGLAARIRGEGT